MFFVALGLGPASVITSFIQCVIIDSIVVRKYEWSVAFELMVVLFRKIENSVGNKFNLGNVIDEVTRPWAQGGLCTCRRVRVRAAEGSVAGLGEIARAPAGLREIARATGILSERSPELQIPWESETMH